MAKQTTSQEACQDAESRDARMRIIEAASRLIAEGGVAALTTRAVAAAASVQAPTLYRLFGDKRGLLDAVAEHGFEAFVAEKASAAPNPNPVQHLRDAWDTYVAFGLSNPAVFAIIHEVRAPHASSPAAAAGLDVLRKRIGRIARAGRLRLPEERAVALVHAAGVGTVSTLLALPEKERDPALSSTAREVVMTALVADDDASAGSDIAMLAIALRAHLETAKTLTPGERLLLHEWLSRLAAHQA